MSRTNDTTRTPYFHPDDPAGWLKPDEPFIVDGLDWSWAFVWYKGVPDFPGYCAGSNGTVWSCLVLVRLGRNRGNLTVLGEAWKPLKHAVKRRKYLAVSLRRDKKAYPFWIHRIIMETFIGPRHPGQECCHWDDDGTNNRLSNLRWDTHLSNKADSARNNTILWGAANHRAKLSEDQVRAIREIYRSGRASQNQLARQFGVRQSAISSIVLLKSWLKPNC